MVLTFGFEKISTGIRNIGFDIDNLIHRGKKFKELKDEASTLGKDVASQLGDSGDNYSKSIADGFTK